MLAEMQVIFYLKFYFLSSEFLSKILDISNFTFQSKDMEKDEDLSEKWEIFHKKEINSYVKFAQ